MAKRKLKALRLSAKLWAEHLHQVRSKACHKLNENKRRAKRHRLIESHMGNVRGIAATVRHMFPAIPFDDLVSCGYVGLCEAAGRYEPGRGAFAPYAYQRIRGAIIDAHKRRAFKEELHDSLDDMLDTRELGDLGNRGPRDSPYVPRRETRLRDPAAGPEEICFAHERKALAYAAIVVLPDEERAVLGEVLAGTQLVDIARACGRSTAWVRSRVVSGSQTLADIMERAA